MQQNELANGRMLAYFGTETDRFMHLIDQGKINLRYDIDAQRDNAESNTEIFAQLQRERNDFLQRQSRNNEVIGEDKVSIPRMNANGQFEKDGEVLRENGKELNGRWFLEQQLKQIERTPILSDNAFKSVGIGA